MQNSLQTASIYSFYLFIIIIRKFQWFNTLTDKYFPCLGQLCRSNDFNSSTTRFRCAIRVQPKVQFAKNIFTKNAPKSIDWCRFSSGRKDRQRRMDWEFCADTKSSMRLEWRRDNLIIVRRWASNFAPLLFVFDEVHCSSKYSHCFSFFFFTTDMRKSSESLQMQKKTLTLVFLSTRSFCSILLHFHHNYHYVYWSVAISINNNRISLMRIAHKSQLFYSKSRNAQQTKNHVCSNESYIRTCSVTERTHEFIESITECVRCDVSSCLIDAHATFLLQLFLVLSLFPFFLVHSHLFEITSIKK